MRKHITAFLTLMFSLSAGSILAQNPGVDPGPSIQYVYRVNETSGSQQYRLGVGPSVVDADALASGHFFELVNAALAVGPPEEVTVIPAFDAGEFPDGAVEVLILTKPVNIATRTSFFLQPGIIVSPDALPNGISQPDFRNLYFRDYSVSVNQIDVNQTAAIPFLFGPLAVTGAQLGNPTATTPFLATAYNITLRIESPGQHLVGVQWKTYKTLAGVLPGGLDLPAAEVKIAIPVDVSGNRQLPVYQQDSVQLTPSGMLETQSRLLHVVGQAITEYRLRH